MEKTSKITECKYQPIDRRLQHQVWKLPVMEAPRPPEATHFKCTSMKSWHRKSLQGGLYLPQIVEVVLPPHPFVVSVGAVGLRGDVFDIRAITVVELAFKKLHLRTQIKKKMNKSQAALKSLIYLLFL